MLPNIEQQDEKPNDVMTTVARRTRFFIIDSVRLERVVSADHMQQHELKESANVAAVMMSVRRRNILRMLGRIMMLATKKTVHEERKSSDGKNLLNDPSWIRKLFMLNVWRVNRRSID